MGEGAHVIARLSATRLCATAALALLAAAPVAAAKWAVVPGDSRIVFTATWLGKPVTGAFGRWTGAIDFDPAAPATAAVAVTVDLASAKTGDPTVDDALPGDDWFGIKAGPQARFATSKVVAAGPGKYVATGTLTLHGRTVPVTLPFDLVVAGDTATMSGRAMLDRRAWKLGIESDARAEYVAFAVPVTIRVVARRIK